jgi:ATP-dependent Clp protease ATP-binding subunit ClpA
MFERFSDRARKAVVRAQEEAKTRDQDYVGSEHLLLGLTHESIGGVAAKTLESLGIGNGDSVAGRVLAELGADLDGARAQVVRLLDAYQRAHEHETE